MAVRKYIRLFFRWLLRIALAMASVLLLLAIVLQFVTVQTWLARKFTHELSLRTGTEITVDRIAIRLPGSIKLNNVFLEDHRGDTLLFVGALDLNISLQALFNNHVEVRKLQFNDATVNLMRVETDTVFNYDRLLRSITATNQNATDVSQYEPATGSMQYPHNDPALNAEKNSVQNPLNNIDKPDDRNKRGPWTVGLGRAALINTRFRYADHASGIDLYVRLDELAANVDSVDLSLNQYFAGDIRLGDGVVALSTFKGTVAPSPKPDNGGVLPVIGVDLLQAGNLAFSFFDNDRLVIDTRLDKLAVKPRTIDLEKMHFSVDELLVRAFTAELPDMAFSGIAFESEDVFYAPDSIGGIVRHLAFEEQDGIMLSHFSADVGLGRVSELNNMHLETKYSFAAGHLYTSVPLMQFSFPPEAGRFIDLDIHEGRIGRDLKMLIPEAGFLFPDSQAPAVDFFVSANGLVEDLSLDTLAVVIPGRARLAASGKVSGYPDTGRLFIDLPFISMGGDPDIVRHYIPGGVVPDNLVLPGSFDLEASFSGAPDHFYADARLTSDVVSLAATFGFDNTIDEDPSWEASLVLIGEDPLSVFAQDSLVKNVSVSISTHGKGFDPAAMTLELAGVADSLWFNEYTYRGLAFEVTAEDGLSALTVNYQDDHLSFNALNQFDLRNEEPRLHLDWEIEHLNARQLNFTEELIAIHTHMKANLSPGKSGIPNGNLLFYDTRVLLDREVFTLDTLQISSFAASGRYAADIKSPVIRANYRGNIPPTDMPSVLAGHFMHYVETGNGHAETDHSPASFNMSLVVEPSPFFSELLFPQLEIKELFTVGTNYDGRTSMLTLDASIPGIAISDWHMDDVSIQAGSNRDYMDFSIRMPLFEGEQITLHDINATGSIREHVLAFDLSFDDENRRSWLGVSGQLQRTEEYTEIRFDRDMVVNRRDWTVHPDHFLRITSNNILSYNLRIASDIREVAVYSTDIHDPMSPLEIHLQQIDLGSFDLISGTPLLEGIVNGSVVLSDLLYHPAFTAGLEINKMGFQGEPIGDVALSVNSPESGLFQLDASVRGYGNRLDVTGTYRSDTPAFLDVVLRVDNLELTTLEALTHEHLSGMEGRISAELQITGDPSAPRVRGDVHLDQVAFHVAFLNVRYTIPGETVVFEDNRVFFSDFALVDRSERTAVLDGQVLLHDLSDIRFDLKLSSANFLLLDQPRGANDLFYGRLLIDTELGLSGNLTRPALEGRIKLNQGSAFAFIPPQSMPEAIGDEGVVEFVTIYDDLFADLLLRPGDVQPMMSAMENTHISVNVEIDPQTDVRILIDEVAGDYLEAKGGGLISYGVDHGGRISLAGRYEIESGAYQMTFYDVIRRNFQIERGSHIVWIGDPLDATVNITARYTVRTSTRELMASQAPGAGQFEGAYRQIYPFDVFLRMEGELMRPEISFEIALPPEHRGAMEGHLQARLNDLNESESELNKQVFALLIIGSFIHDDPLDAVTGGPGITATARSSASRILSQQLNRLSDKYIRGIDLSFEVESYEQVVNGQLAGRTELQMEVSRDFLDQRLRITAGGHLELEDETRRQINPADIAGDFSVEYLLDADGRFTLKGYRERKFQDVFDGEVIETGLSLIMRQTFTQFRELFMKKEEETEVEVP